jgi:hypothetical protein
MFITHGKYVCDCSTGYGGHCDNVNIMIFWSMTVQFALVTVYKLMVVNEGYEYQGLRKGALVRSLKQLVSIATAVIGSSVTL